MSLDARVRQDDIAILASSDEQCVLCRNRYRSPGMHAAHDVHSRWALVHLTMTVRLDGVGVHDGFSLVRECHGASGRGVVAAVAMMTVGEIKNRRSVLPRLTLSLRNRWPSSGMLPRSGILLVVRVVS